MTEYFYNQNDEQKGPINLEELKNLISTKIINSNTLIWKEGLEDWKKISEFEEFKSLFLTPPPIKKEDTTNKNQSIPKEESKTEKPKKKKKSRFWLWLLLLLIAGGFGGNYIYQQQKEQSVKSSERFNPQRHLRVDNADTKMNLLLDNVVKGTITNTSKRTTYGEIVLELTWYNKKGKLISKRNYTINKNVRPYGSTEFKIKDQAPFKARKYDVRVTDATVVNQY